MAALITAPFARLGYRFIGNLSTLNSFLGGREFSQEMRISPTISKLGGLRYRREAVA
jgi:hypothetical protein